MNTFPGSTFLPELICDKDDCRSAEPCVYCLKECMCNSERNSNSNRKDFHVGVPGELQSHTLNVLLIYNLIK